MPAAAVIPAPMAYIKVAALKKLVVECVWCNCSPPRGSELDLSRHAWSTLLLLTGWCAARDI